MARKTSVLHHISRLVVECSLISDACDDDRKIRSFDTLDYETPKNCTVLSAPSTRTVVHRYSAVSSTGTQYPLHHFTLHHSTACQFVSSPMPHYPFQSSGILGGRYVPPWRSTVNHNKARDNERQLHYLNLS